MRGRLEIEVRKDAMAVTAYVIPEGTAEITEQLVREQLAACGVKAGICSELLSQFVEQGVYNRKYPVAAGQPAVDGKNGYYEYFFERDVKEFVPTIREDGSVDYSPTIQFVEQGSRVAVYHPAEPGSSGHTVFNETIAPMKSRELPPLVCKNVERKENTYYAATRGRVSLSGNVIEVCNNLTIDGDAGYSIGTIDFNGDVVVRGDVLTDVVIRAGGDITVDGVVEGATLVTTGNIVVRHGVHGKGKAVFEAGGSITSNFIEAAKLTAGKDIRVDYMANTQARAGQTVFATGRKGQIIGGETYAGKAIDAFRIGNEVGTRTRIYAESEDAGRRLPVKIVIRKKILDGVELRLNGMPVNRLPSSGEFHYVDGEVKIFEVGKFRGETPEPGTTAAGHSKKPLILIVDDDPVMLRAEYNNLCKDYRVATASSAQDALLYLRRNKPDLVLLDYLMPQINGGKLLERIRAERDKEVANVAVFFVTSVTDKRIVRECLKLYPQGYLIKPLGKEELLKIIADFFAKNKVRHE